MPIPTNRPLTSSPSHDPFDGVAYAALATPVAVADQPPVDASPVENPYAAPVSNLETTSADDAREHMLPAWKVDRIRWVFKYCMVTVALSFVGRVLILFVPVGNLHPLILELPIACLGFTVWVLLILLAYNVKGVFSSILTGVLLNIPLLNLCILLGLFDRTRTVMKKHGYKCGIFQLTFDQALFDEAMAEIAHRELMPTVKPKRSPVATAITYAIIGLLIGLVAISILNSI